MTGADLKRIRLELGRTAEQFGQALGKHWTEIYRWEREERAIPAYIEKLVQLYAKEQGK